MQTTAGNSYDSNISPSLPYSDAFAKSSALPKTLLETYSVTLDLTGTKTGRMRRNYAGKYIYGNPLGPSSPWV